LNENTAANENEVGRDGISRRTIVRGAAWSVPVIATAVAMPLASASGEIRIRITLPGAGGCAEPGMVLADALDIDVVDDSGPVAGASVAVTFASSDGGTLSYGGQTYPGSTTPVTVVTDATGHAKLTNVTLLTPTTITAQATVTMPDGRTATSNAAVYQVCAPCAQEDFAGPYRGMRDAVVDADGNLYVSAYNYDRQSDFSVKKLNPDGSVAWTRTWLDGCLGLQIGPDGMLYASHGWSGASGPTGVYRLDPATGIADPTTPYPNGEMMDWSWIRANAAGYYPYGITFSPDGGTFFVSDYRDSYSGKIVAVDLATGAHSIFAGKTDYFQLVDIVSDGGDGFYGLHWDGRLVHIAADGSESLVASFSERYTNYFNVYDGYAYVGTGGATHYRVDLDTGAKEALTCLRANYVTQIVRIPDTNDAYVIQWETGAGKKILKAKNLFV